MDLTQEIIDYLEQIANKKTSDENDEEFWSTGNYDTTYYMGVEDGQIRQARQILNMAKKN